MYNLTLARVRLLSCLAEEAIPGNESCGDQGRPDHRQLRQPEAYDATFVKEKFKSLEAERNDIENVLESLSRRSRRTRGFVSGPRLPTLSTARWKTSASAKNAESRLTCLTFPKLIKTRIPKGASRTRKITTVSNEHAGGGRGARASRTY